MNALLLLLLTSSPDAAFLNANQSSELVVKAVVTKAQSRWTQDKTNIVTDVEVDVFEEMKGTAPRRIKLVKRGGEMGDVVQVVSHEVALQPGDKVKLALRRHGARLYRVVGRADWDGPVSTLPQKSGVAK